MATFILVLGFIAVCGFILMVCGMFAISGAAAMANQQRDNENNTALKNIDSKAD